MELASNANEVLDSYDDGGQEFPKHWNTLMDMGAWMEKDYLRWRHEQADSRFEPIRGTNADRYLASFMGLWAARPLLQAHVENAASCIVEAGHTGWTADARTLMNSEFCFGQTVAVVSRSIHRAAHDFEGWGKGGLSDMRMLADQRRHDNRDRQRDALMRINAQLGVNSGDIRHALGPLSTPADIARARRSIKDKKKRERGAIKRSTKFLTKLVGSETTRLYVSGHAIRFEGQHGIYELAKKSRLTDAHGGYRALSVFDKDRPEIHLCDVCIFTTDVPLLDHVASLIMHIQSGHEEEILKIGNAQNVNEEAYALDWCAPYMPVKKDIDFQRVIVASRPPWVPEGLVVTDKERKKKVVQKEINRWLYDTLLVDHAPMFNTLTGIMENERTPYLPDYGAMVQDQTCITGLMESVDQILAYEPDQEWVDG